MIGSPSPTLANVARFLPEMAARQPQACALRVPQGTTAGGSIQYLERSFAALEAESNGMARLLRDAGLKRGTRTLLMVRPGLELIELCFALFKLGAVPIVIDPGMGLRGFLRCVRRSQPEALVGIPLAQTLARVFFPSFRCLRHRVSVRPELVARAAAAGGTFSPAATTADELAAVLFTSGSTGPAKGVCYQHGQFEAQVRLIRRAFDIRPGEVDLPMLPIFALFNPALGMTTVVPEMNPSRPASADPARLVQALRQNGVTNSFGSPVLWGKVLRHLAACGERVEGLRRVLMAGAPVPPELYRLGREHLPGAALWSPYGATESLPLSAIEGTEVLRETAALTDGGAGTCVGRPLPEITLRVIAPQDGPIPDERALRFLPPGEIGEIIARGPVVTAAYDQLPEATAAAKVPATHGTVWHRLGDLGYLDDQGRLWFCGRKAERVHTAAGPLDTDRCEAIFNRLAGVRRSALLGIGPQGKQTPILAIEPDPSAPRPSLGLLRQTAQSHAHTAVIREFRFVRRFPVDVRHNAKIHRLQLARRLG